MTVAEKYKPIALEPTQTSAPGGIVVGLWIATLVLALLNSQSLVREAGSRDDGWFTSMVVAAASTADGVARAVGASSVRQGLDGVIEPLDDTRRLWRSPPPPRVVVPAVGAAFVHPAQADGPRSRQILLVGASSVQFRFGVELERMLESYSGVTVERHGKLSTGLARPDYFDWPAEIARRQAELRPDVVIMQFGGNDAQPMEVSGERVPFGTDAWDQEYRRRLEVLIGQVRTDGAVPVVLGLPMMKSETHRERVERVNGLSEQAAAAAGARWVELWSLTSNPDGGYRSHITWENRNTLLRLPDGTHLSSDGSAYVAQALAPQLERSFTLVSTDPSEAVALRRDLLSKARGKHTPYLAFLPQQIPAEGLPVLYLLHGAWDGWTAWSDHAHDDLQRLASEHGIILVLPDGEPFGWYLDSPRVEANQIERYLLEELLPDVDQMLPSNRVRGIAGLSMGGHGALSLSLRHPGRFRSASSMSGAVDLDFVPKHEHLTRLLGPHGPSWDPHNTMKLVTAEPEALAGLSIKLDCGSEDKWYPSNLELHEQLEALGVSHAWDGVEGAGHTWDYWTSRLPEHIAFHAAALRKP